ncbi:MAG TPA: AAA family ATPase [Devosiaceae bacterium]|nr:AAA family ATPase [Devosiaceae bacterium]
MQILWEDGERALCRAWRNGAYDGGNSSLVVLLTAEHPSALALDRLAHEFGLKDELKSEWAVRPIELVRESGRTFLVLEDPGGEPLEGLLGAPREIGASLRLAVDMAAALGRLHEGGLVHRDIKPAHIVVNCPDGLVRFTGFGLASRLPRERRAPAPPETIAGTLAYMAPEQTGRMNRSVDARSDLYSLGVVLYQMFTGTLPFTATDPMEWVHSHIARRPTPPSERRGEVPLVISEIVMKLLAKTTEERYQSAAGLARDLRRCLAQWEAGGRIDGFSLGAEDTPDRLMIPEKLYGRERDIEALLESFARVVTGGTPELVLVTGYSGIGKSSVVDELQKALVPSRGLFASGKFDQYKRDIPYSTLVQAFQSLVRPLLGRSDAELATWRSAFLEALEPNARLMTDLIPELQLIIGDQPPVPELDPQQARTRFQLVFWRFIGVFARREHPLALFLDDLQWLDAATLDLLEDLLTRSDLQHLLLVGAYRDNEVDVSHPLMRKLDAIRQAGAKVEEIRLAPLGRDDIEQLIADALRCEPARAVPLAQLVHDKTAGNPFFVIQFVYALAEAGLLRFDHVAARWSWDLNRIHAAAYTDNVADLMLGKLARLPLNAQQALQQMACLGNIAEISMLTIVLQTSEEMARAILWPAIRQELIEQREGAYRFSHDRVQEAAYMMIPAEMRAEVHLRIGRLLAAQTPAEKREEAIFEIVNQLNRGAQLITEQQERDELAELNLIAGRRAKAATAYVSALNYLNAGTALLAEDCWERQHELAFALAFDRAECEFLTGELGAAEERLNELSIRAKNSHEQASVAGRRVDLYMILDQDRRAMTVGLEYLQQLGVDWPPHPTEEQVRREYQRIWAQLAGRDIEELIDLPLMSDPDSLATIDVLARMIAPAVFFDAGLFALVVCRTVNLSLERGNCDASCFGYAMLGALAGPVFGEYPEGYRFGRLGCELVEQRGMSRFEGAAYTIQGSMVTPWTKHARTGQDLIRHAFVAANRTGDLPFAAYSCNHLNTNMLLVGNPLEEVQREAEKGLAFARKARFGNIVDIINSQLGLIRTLRGLTPKFGSFNDDQFDELEIEQRFAGNPNFALAECWYWIRKMAGHFLAGDHAAAVTASQRARPLLWTTAAFLEVVDYHFYGALARAASYGVAPSDERQQHLEALAAHQRQLQDWAGNCPENFESRAALAAAEIARVEGRDADAMGLYEQAIRSARTNGFVQVEAIANELASRFYAARGFDKIARVYLQDARYCYLRWGADGKARQLEELYPYLRPQEPAPGPASTIGTPVEHLDLATVIKVSQAVSGEMVLEKLIDTLMRTAIAQAGAERGLLILSRAGESRIAAEATTASDEVLVDLRDAPVSALLLPETVLRSVLHTRESVILDDAAAEPDFAADPYIQRRRMRSVLCLPLINQAKLIGVLYLENSLAPGVFAPAQIAVLKLLASQAAISLENTRLYRDLAQREAKIRRLVDANIIGIFVWDFEGHILEANDAFLRLVGYEREELTSGQLRWTELTPPEWYERDARQWVPEVRTSGFVQPYEKEYFRKDGSRVPVLIGAATIEQDGDEGVAFVLDLSERKRAEAEARDSEQRYREVQAALAHANRVATMGQLTASIAHEVKQPITSTVLNAQVALLLLNRQPRDEVELREALEQIARDGNRASDVINRIRALVQNAPLRRDRLEIDGIIHEVIELTRAEAAESGVSVRTELAQGLPPVQGDRVQLQQVILNLIINAIEAMSGLSDGPRELLIGAGWAEPNGVLVTVRDSGPGLSPGALDSLFEAFHTTKPSGLGLGLSISRSIVEAHGGRLWASANLPRGTMFQFTVPAHYDLAG